MSLPYFYLPRRIVVAAFRLYFRRRFSLFFFFFFLYMAGILQTGTISRYNTEESHSLMHYSQLCGTQQPRLCALELLPKEFTGGISDDPCRALHSNAARPRHTCAALITLLPNSLTWLGEPVSYGKDTCQRCRMEGSNPRPQSWK